MRKPFNWEYNTVEPISLLDKLAGHIDDYGINNLLIANEISSIIDMSYILGAYLDNEKRDRFRYIYMVLHDFKYIVFEEEETYEYYKTMIKNLNSFIKLIRYHKTYPTVSSDHDNMDMLDQQILIYYYWKKTIEGIDHDFLNSSEWLHHNSMMIAANLAVINKKDNWIKKSYQELLFYKFEKNTSEGFNRIINKIKELDMVFVKNHCII